MHPQRILAHEVGMKLVNGEVVNRRLSDIGFNRDNFGARPRARDDARPDADFASLAEATALDVERMLVGRLQNRAALEAQFTRPDVRPHAGVKHFLGCDFARFLVLRENTLAYLDLLDRFENLLPPKG